MMANIVNLSMTVVTTGNTIIRTGLHYLIKFELAVGPPFLLKAGLEKSAAAAAAIIVRSIGGHLNDVFFADNLFHDITQIFGNGFTIAFPDNLAGILDGEFDLPLLIPVGVDLQAPLPDPFRIVLIY